MRVPLTKELLRSFLVQPVVVLLFSCACGAGISAFAQSGALAQRGSVAPPGGRTAAQPGEHWRSCRALADGRGKQVLAGEAAQTVAAFSSKDCLADDTRAAPIARQPAPIARQPAPVARRPTKSPERPSTEVPRLAAGSVAVDPISDAFGESASGAVHVTPERLTAVVLTGGTALFLVQSSFWTYLLILGLPLWRHVDLLPIVDTEMDDNSPGALPAHDEETERAVADVLGTQGGEHTGSQAER